MQITRNLNEERINYKKTKLITPVDIREDNVRPLCFIDFYVPC